MLLPEVSMSKPVRTAIVVVNNRIKPELATLLRDYGSVFQLHYDEIFATDGTAEIIRSLLPATDIQSLGHGPDKGDHNAAERGLRCAEQGHEVHLYFLKDPYIEPHQPFKDNLMAFALAQKWVVFPTPTAARAYLAAVSETYPTLDYLLERFADLMRYSAGPDDLQSVFMSIIEGLIAVEPVNRGANVFVRKLLVALESHSSLELAGLLIQMFGTRPPCPQEAPGGLVSAWARYGLDMDLAFFSREPEI